MQKRVMIVDDSPVMRAFVRRILEASGLPVCGIAEASNGSDALSLLRDDPRGVDLILTDINMPVMDGEALLSSLKEDPALSCIPVVVVSTDSTAQRVDSLLRLGARAYVRKPFPPERLGGVLSQVLPDWAMREEF